MCGRFALAAPKAMLESLFGLEIAGDLPPRYNIAPSQPIAAVRAPGSGARELTLFQWGLVPSWSKDPAIGARMINARAETAAEKPSFRAAMKRRRCLVPASGFYEWAKVGASKQPFYIRMRDERPFAMAGLWELWCGEDGSELETCAILTTAPNEVVGKIHGRMPVIIAPDDFDAWMDPANEKPETVATLLRPYPSVEMAAHPVARRMNSPAADDALCIEPISDEPPPEPLHEQEQPPAPETAQPEATQPEATQPDLFSPPA